MTISSHCTALKLQAADPALTTVVREIGDQFIHMANGRPVN